MPLVQQGVLRERTLHHLVGPSRSVRRVVDENILGKGNLTQRGAPPPEVAVLAKVRIVERLIEAADAKRLGNINDILGPAGTGGLTRGHATENLQRVQKISGGKKGGDKPRP